MKSKLPKTKIVVFEQEPGSSSPDWTKPLFLKEDAPNWIKSFKAPCEGDSGSGQIFLVISDPKTTDQLKARFALGAVYYSATAWYQRVFVS